MLHLFSWDRPVLSVDESEDWIESFGRFRSANHRIEGYADRSWDKGVQWGVVLVDHSAGRRIDDLRHLADCAQYLILHDAGPGNDFGFRFSRYFEQFGSVVFSNYRNLDDLFEG